MDHRNESDVPCKMFMAVAAETALPEVAATVLPVSTAASSCYSTFG